MKLIEGCLTRPEINQHTLTKNSLRNSLANSSRNLPSNLLTNTKRLLIKLQPIVNKLCLQIFEGVQSQLLK